MQILWFKRNLRLQDSEPLFNAMKSFRTHGTVLPLYCHEPSLISQPDVSRQHQMFIQETLAELSVGVQSIGGQLIEVVGEAPAVFDRIHRVTPITRIWTHRETTQDSNFKRDKAVLEWCRANGVQMMEVEQNGLARGAQVAEAFPQYFSRAVNAQLRDPTGKDLSERFSDLPFPSSSIDEIPLAKGFDKPHRQHGGRAAAIQNLNRFFTAANLKRYPYQISSPNTAWEGCSRISTYMAYGIISDRMVFQAVDRAVTHASGTMSKPQFEKFQDNARFYLDRLTWRRQYMQTFETNPKLEFECMLPQFNGVREAEFDEAKFEAFKEGRTGFAYIDAGIRCLSQTGWVNMRLRATLVSFSTMNLWAPTTKVAEFLAREFLDYEPAIHHVIHQLIAGTTTFSSMMVYDPIKQGLDHDAKGEFIKRWLPELKDLPPNQLHDTACTQGSLSKEADEAGYGPYPGPIVDHKSTAKIAKDRVHSIKHGILQSTREKPEDVVKKREFEGQQNLF
jgi:deoxyribodipyrimidine photo-lyase